MAVSRKGIAVSSSCWSLEENDMTSDGDAVGGRGGLFGDCGGDGAGLETFDDEVDPEGELPHGYRGYDDQGRRRGAEEDCDGRGDEQGGTDEPQRRNETWHEARPVHQGAEQ